MFNLTFLIVKGKIKREKYVFEAKEEGKCARNEYGRLN